MSVQVSNANKKRLAENLSGKSAQIRSASKSQSIHALAWREFPQRDHRCLINKKLVTNFIEI